ncbi:MAG TPA: hypothetical protein VFE32_22340 [Puia sp.]|jgi:hypothetical protein|nr:hypothetical protein [Puia sp.]
MNNPKTTIGAVLTADIVNSTKLSPPIEANVRFELGLLLGKFLKRHSHEFYRGDSFQAYIEEPSKALHLALACRAVAIKITSKDDTTVRGDIRIGIGIGEIDVPIRALGSAKGEAFLLSGRGLDELERTERRLAISCSNEIANIGLQTMADYLDSIFLQMTGKQADVIVELLQGVTQQQLTISREKAKSTISELANAGRWPEIERILQQYEQVIKLLT